VFQFTSGKAPRRYKLRRGLTRPVLEHGQGGGFQPPVGLRGSI
jgi:hypothetical protein